LVRKSGKKSAARIRLESEDPKHIDYVIEQIKNIATALNMGFKGPIPLPKKRLRVTVRRTPCGDGSDTYETWWKEISRKFVIVEGDEKSLKYILRVKIPEDVYVKIIL